MIVALWILLLALVATVVVGVANGRHKSASPSVFDFWRCYGVCYGHAGGLLFPA